MKIVMNKITGLIAFALFLAVCIVCKPEFLSDNTFLRGFINHEILALMAVIMTITLASVANIHISLNSLVLRRFGGNEPLKEAAAGVKKEMTDNAWLIFWGFLVTAIVLVAKGAFDDKNVLAYAITHGVCLWFLLLYFLCMYDIYKVVFGIVELELKVGDPPAARK